MSEIPRRRFSFQQGAQISTLAGRGGGLQWTPLFSTPQFAALSASESDTHGCTQPRCLLQQIPAWGAEIQRHQNCLKTAFYLFIFPPLEKMGCTFCNRGPFFFFGSVPNDPYPEDFLAKLPLVETALIARWTLHMCFLQNTELNDKYLPHPGTLAVQHSARACKPHRCTPRAFGEREEAHQEHVLRPIFTKFFLAIPCFSLECTERANFL